MVLPATSRARTVGAVRDHDAGFGAGAAPISDGGAIGVGHLKAVEQHHGLDHHRHATPAQREHLVDVSVLEEQRAADLVVVFVEGAAGHKETKHGAL
jgi:hypothetical protein